MTYRNRINPPIGRFRIMALPCVSLDTVRIFAISKLGWIKQQQTKFQGQPREIPREYLDRESHYVWGKRYLLDICEREQPPLVVLEHRRIVLSVRPSTSERKRQDIVEEWYRVQLKAAIPALIAKWEPLLDVKVERFFVQRRKTHWRSGTRAHARFVSTPSSPRNHLGASNISSSTRWPTCLNQPTTAISSPSWSAPCPLGIITTTP